MVAMEANMSRRDSRLKHRAQTQPVVVTIYSLPHPTYLRVETAAPIRKADADLVVFRVENRRHRRARRQRRPHAGHLE